VDRIFNKILKTFGHILKTSELPLPLLQGAEVSPLHQLHMGHATGLSWALDRWYVGEWQNVFLLFFNHKTKWTIYWTLEGLWESRAIPLHSFCVKE